MNDANVKALESLNNSLRALFERNTRRLESYAGDTHAGLIGIEGHLHDRLAEVLGSVSRLQNACDDFENDTVEDLQASASQAETMNRRLCQLVVDIHPDNIKEHLEKTCPMALRTLSADFQALNALSDLSQVIYNAERQALDALKAPAHGPAPVHRLTLVYSTSFRNNR